MPAASHLPDSIRQYAIVTGSYWAFTLTDGALRMLVVLHFHALGYSPLQIAFLFLFYEVFGVITNLVGGWLGARLGLNRTMNIGLALQIAALSMLMVPPSALSVAWVMAAQALSGIAKDLNKMSAKSSIKLLVSDAQQSHLYTCTPVHLGGRVDRVQEYAVIGYGLVQALAPRLTGNSESKQPGGQTAFAWAALLAIIPAGIALALNTQFHIQTSLVIGLLTFGAVFAINSSLHSYLILSHANRDGVSLDLGFYYMANALSRLLGTVLSGWLFQRYSLEICLWVSTLFVVLSAVIVFKLPDARQYRQAARSEID